MVVSSLRRAHQPFSHERVIAIERIPGFTVKYRLRFASGRAADAYYVLVDEATDRPDESSSNLASVLGSIHTMRRYSRDGEYSPHKPLLLLMAFARVQRRLPRLMSFNEIEEPLRALLDEFWPAPQNHPEYPFVRLEPALWELRASRSIYSGRTDPTASDLRDHRVEGGLRVDVYDLLLSNPAALEAAIAATLSLLRPEIRDAALARAGWQGGSPNPDIGRSELTSPDHETDRDNLLRRAIHAVLAAAPEYSRTATPAMRRRGAALADMVARLDQVVPELSQGLGLASLGLRAGRGGHQASYSPTAWVRIYAPDYSPRAMEGFYVAYLFATDGSAVYVSLMQGTSEYRSGAMRPVNDREEVRARAAEARRSLSGFEGIPLMRSATVAMDLTWGSTPGVGPESRRRTRNYEDANIIALRYSAAAIPPDADLLQDLSDMLPLLAALYQQPQDPLPAEPTLDEAPPGETGGIAKRTRQRERDNQLDQAVRTTIEKFAEDEAERALGPDWDVIRVGHLRLGYDLDCRHRRTGRTLHVEVKGTQTPGEEVVLTRNEVRHHQAHGGDCSAEHALFVLSRVEVARTPPISCAGGTPFLHWDWSPEQDALDPTEYTYRVPRESGDSTT
jgi:hypothetical protein